MRTLVRHRVVLAIVAIFVMFCGGWGVVFCRSTPLPGSTWVDSLSGNRTVKAIQSILDRRAMAVRLRDKATFMEVIDKSDADFVRRQEVVFDNLMSLPISHFSYVLESKISYPKSITERFFILFGSVVYAPGVTIFYTIDGVDSRVVAAPWVPIFGRRNGTWIIAGEAEGKGLPYGVNGQLWDANPVAIMQSSRVTVVFSVEDTKRASYLLNLADVSLKKTYFIRPDDWDGKVLVTAVQDQRIFHTYFSSSPDRIAQVAAIAVPYYNQVPDWHGDSLYATTRVLFNPQQLSAQPEELAHDLTHEFVHAAMGPVTVSATPRWLVEGFAEYIAYKGEKFTDSTLPHSIQRSEIPSILPEDSTFYADSKNYVTSWLACKMIVEKYSENHLIKLYESFRVNADPELNLKSILGIGRIDLVNQLYEYIVRGFM